MISSPIGSGNGCGASTAVSLGNTSAGLPACSSRPMDYTNSPLPRYKEKKAIRRRNPESRMRENRPSGLMRGGKQTVIGPTACQSVVSRLLYSAARRTSQHARSFPIPESSVKADGPARAPSYHAARLQEFVLPCEVLRFEGSAQHTRAALSSAPGCQNCGIPTPPLVAPSRLGAGLLPSLRPVLRLHRRGSPLPSLNTL